MEKYQYYTHNTCNFAVQRYLGFAAIFFRFRIKLHFHIISSVNMCQILVTGLILCSGAGRLPWVGEYRLSHGLMKIFRNV
jgi:hypothetical protein